MNACYPKDLDPLSCAPDGNSLGKLAYYCSKRPHKLPKTSSYLVSLAKKEASQGGAPKAQGGLIVTLEILKELVKECPSQLQFFGAQVLEAVGIAFDASAGGAGVAGKGGEADLEVLSKAAGLWRAFTTYANGDIVGTDRKVTDQYMHILGNLATMAKRGYADGRDENKAAGCAVITPALTKTAADSKSSQSPVHGDRCDRRDGHVRGAVHFAFQRAGRDLRASTVAQCHPRTRHRQAARLRVRCFLFGSSQTVA